MYAAIIKSYMNMKFENFFYHSSSNFLKRKDLWKKKFTFANPRNFTNGKKNCIHRFGMDPYLLAVNAPLAFGTRCVVLEKSTCLSFK